MFQIHPAYLNHEDGKHLGVEAVQDKVKEASAADNPADTGAGGDAKLDNGDSKHEEDVGYNHNHEVRNVGAAVLHVAGGRQ